MAAYHYQQGDRPLDGYTIQYALGRGGFGEVYFAISDSGREVALKAVQNFEEVELRGIGHCMNLKSPHLVMIFDIKHANDGTPWVIMEYVAGPSLRDILDESPQGLEIEQAVFFLKELAKGLSYLHEAGVVHRDLKPHNVFLEDGIVKIGDYSLSKVITVSHRSGNTMTVGSVHYMAPEISMGRYDKTVDVYALGVILYEMLTGEPPHVGESMGEVLMKHLNIAPDVSDIPEPFAGVIQKAMAKDPVERFQTAEEMITVIEGTKNRSSLDDSFNPATLSLVGERARKTRQNHTISPSSHQQALPLDAPAPRHSTAPTAAATHQTNAQLASSDKLLPPRKVSWWQAAGLHYSPAERMHTVADTVWIVPRLCLAFLVTISLVVFGASSPFAMVTQWDWTETISSVTVIAVLALGSTAAGCRLLPFHKGFWPAILSRIPWIVPWGVAVWLAHQSRLPGVLPQTGPILFPILAALVIPDWRCLLASDRHIRVSPMATVVVGAIAALVATPSPNHTDHKVFCGAITIAVAFIVQLTAPLHQATWDAPENALARPTKKPRLLFDKIAMLQELIAAAAAVVIAGLLINGDGNGELVTCGVIAAFVGTSSLRFRLQRRAWPQKQNDYHGKGALLFDWPAVIMELIAGGAATIVIGLSIANLWYRRVDEEVVLFGVVSACVGLFALRFRLQRRRWSDLTGNTNTHSMEKAVVDEPHNEDSHSRKKNVTLDKRSLILELIAVAAAAGIGVLINEGDASLFPFGVAMAVAGILALRYRFRRYRYRPAGGQPKPPLSFDILSVLLEWLVGCCAVCVAAIVLDGDKNYFGLAIAATALGIIAIRFRLARRVSTNEPVNDQPAVLQEGRGTRSRAKKQEIHQ